ncbi:pectinesterase inhibitor-like [Lycium ferocissimum]|uniref:pectinesterase inhibitor-like n=1 Tax=Lycium ferocissimum TaxID=112874 RepID=UPI002814B968|nr:pectinesterase inhibitor-like [Lycium ferocissimum]
MAFSFNKVLLLTFLVIQGMYNAHARSKYPISLICSKSPNPSLCLQAYNSDPRSSNADLVGLCQIAIDFSEKSARQTLDLVNQLQHNAKGAMVTRLQSCAFHYLNCANLFNQTGKILQSGDFQKTVDGGNGALAESANCDASFISSRPKEPDQLRQHSVLVQQLGAVAVLTATWLAHLGPVA